MLRDDRTIERHVSVDVPGARFHWGDPSASAYHSRMRRGRGISCKTVFDDTVPFALRERFERVQSAKWT